MTMQAMKIMMTVTVSMKMMIAMIMTMKAIKI